MQDWQAGCNIEKNLIWRLKSVHVTERQTNPIICSMFLLKLSSPVLSTAHQISTFCHDPSYPNLMYKVSFGIRQRGFNVPAMWSHLHQYDMTSIDDVVFQKWESAKRGDGQSWVGGGHMLDFHLRDTLTSHVKPRSWVISQQNSSIFFFVFVFLSTLHRPLMSRGEHNSIKVSGVWYTFSPKPM